MMKLTRNGFTVLKRRYRSVLLKCLAINAGVFMLSMPATATEISEDTLLNADYTGATYDATAMGGQGALNFDDDLTISGGTNSAETHVMVGPASDFGNGKDITITGGETTFVGRSLNARSGAINMLDGVLNFDNTTDDAENDDLTLWAAKDITITGGIINMNGEDVSIDTNYDWQDADGNPLPAPETAGNIYIAGGTINVNNAGGEIFSESKVEFSNESIVNVGDGGQLFINGDEEGSSGGETVISGNTYFRGYKQLEEVATTEPDIWVNGDLQITEEGYLDISQTGMKTNNGDVTVNGELTLLSSALEAGNDGNASDTSNIIFEGATVSATDSDIEANGSIRISDSQLSLYALSSSTDQDGSGVNEADSFGMWADDNINIENSTVDIISSYIDANGTIVVSGDETTVTMENATLKSKEEDILIEGGVISLDKNSEIKAHNGTLTIAGGEISAGGEKIEIVAKNLNIFGDTSITLNSGAFLEGEESLSITGGEIYAQDSDIVADGDLDIQNAQLYITSSISDDEALDWIENGYADFDNAPEGLSGITAMGNINIADSKVTVDKSFINSIADNGEYRNMNIYGDNTIYTQYMSRVDVGAVNIKSGIVDLEDNSELHAMFKMQIDGGIVNLGDESELMVDVGGGDIPDASGLIMLTGGTINMDGENSSVGVEIPGPTTNFDDDAAGDFIMRGGEVNVNASNAAIVAYDMYMDGGVLNIADGAGLEVIRHAKADEEGNITGVSYSDITMSEGAEINMEGRLISNIKGYDGGLINFNSSDAVIEGDVDSTNLTFYADHAFSEAITGTIGSLNKFTVASGTFSFDKVPTGTITTVEVGNGATLDIGLNTLHSTGDKADGEGVYFEDNSTLKFTATSADEHGQIKANYVNISNNGTTLDMIFNGAALSEGESLTLKLFDQSEDGESVEIEGKFAELANNARYEFTDEGDGVYKITNKASASDVIDDDPTGGDDNPSGGDDNPSGGDDNPSGGDDNPSGGDDNPSGGDDNPSGSNHDKSGSANKSIENNKATAEAWDNVDTGKVTNRKTVAVANELAELSNKATTPQAKKAYKDALTTIAPDATPSVQQATTETIGQVFGAVGSRLSGGSLSGSGRGMSSGDALNGVALWIQGMFNHAKMDDNKDSKGFDSDTWSTAIGLEKIFNSSVKAGIGYAYSESDISGFRRDTDVNTHTALVYGEYRPNNWYVNAAASYGWSDYEEKKDIAGGVKAKYDVEAFGLQAMTGYDILTSAATITPEGGLRYIHIKNEAYNDEAGQRIKNEDSDILTGILGARLSKTYGTSFGSVKPELRAAFTYDLAHDDTKSTVVMPGGPSYNISGKPLNRFGFEVGVGVTAEVSSSVELFLGYEGRFREDYSDHTGIINAKYKF